MNVIVFPYTGSTFLSTIQLSQVVHTFLKKAATLPSTLADSLEKDKNGGLMMGWANVRKALAYCYLGESYVMKKE